MAIALKLCLVMAHLFSCPRSANDVFYARFQSFTCIHSVWGDPKAGPNWSIDINVPHLWFRCIFRHHSSLLALTRQAEYNDEDEALISPSFCFSRAQYGSCDIKHYGVVD